MSNINFYEVIPKKYLDDKYYNPNVKQGALQHPFRTAIVGTTGSMKTNSLLNIIKKCECFDRLYLIAKNTDEPLYKYLIDYYGDIGKKIGKEVISYSNSLDDLPAVDDLDKNLQNLVVIDDMISENLKKHPKLTDLFIRGRKHNCSVAFISQNYYSIPKILRQQCSYFILKRINNKKDIKLIVNESALDKTPEEVFNLYNKASKKNEDFFLIDTVTTDETKRYRKNLDEKI